MRIYLPAGLGEIEALASGGAVSGQAVVPATEDEDDEFVAFHEASTYGPVVISVDLDGPELPVTLDTVAAFHLDIDGSGDLAWFATQEIDAVLLVLRNTASEA